MLLIVLLLAGCKTELHTGLNESEANDIVSVLVNNGIGADKVKDKKSGSFTVRVEESQISLAVETLRRHGLPRERFTRVDDIFKKDGLISSPLEERVRYIYALSEQVEETLSQIDGVVTARVHVVLPENDPFSEDVKPSSAAVFIKYLPGSRINEIKSEIKFIVEKSIEGLSYDKVSLVMLPANVGYASGNEGQWTSFLGIRVPQAQLGLFRTMVWGLLALVTVLVFVIVYLLLQRNESGHQRSEGEGSAGNISLGDIAAEATRSAASVGNMVMNKIKTKGDKT